MDEDKDLKHIIKLSLKAINALEEAVRTPAPDDAIVDDYANVKRPATELKEALEELEGHLRDDVIEAIKREEGLLKELQDMGFKIPTSGIFRKKYDLDRYLSHQLEMLKTTAGSFTLQLTFKDFKRLAGLLREPLQSINTAADNAVRYDDQFKREIEDIIKDSKYLAKML